MFHLAANSASVASIAETDLATVPDAMLAVFNGHWFPQDPPQLIFACAMGAQLARVRIQTPTLNMMTTPFIRGFMLAAIPTSPSSLANYYQNPLQLKAQEEIIIQVTDAAVTAAQETILLGLQFGPSAPAMGSFYTMRGSSTTAAVPNKWTQLTMTWQNQVPQGRYAAVGLQHQSANAQAARLIFLGQYYRPGCVSLANLQDVGHPIFRLGYMGQWGTWNNNIMPNIEVLCNAADAVHEIYLDFMPL
jgi:hypothetical protein